MGWKMIQTAVFGVPIFVSSLILIVLGTRLSHGFDDGPFGDVSRFVTGAVAGSCGFFYPLAFGFIIGDRSEGSEYAETVPIVPTVSGVGIILSILLTVFVGTRNVRSARAIPKISFSPTKVKIYRERQSPLRFTVMSVSLIVGGALNLGFLSVAAG